MADGNNSNGTLAEELADTQEELIETVLAVNIVFAFKVRPSLADNIKSELRDILQVATHEDNLRSMIEEELSHVAADLELDGDVGEAFEKENLRVDIALER